MSRFKEKINKTIFQITSLIVCSTSWLPCQADLNDACEENCQDRCYAECSQSQWGCRRAVLMGGALLVGGLVTAGLYQLRGDRKGDSATTGETGSRGSTGPQGLPGALGVPGITGVSGITGIPGVTGLTGPDGIAGATGLQGATGATGATGLLGSTGPTGAFEAEAGTLTFTATINVLDLNSTPSISYLYYVTRSDGTIVYFPIGGPNIIVVPFTTTLNSAVSSLVEGTYEFGFDIVNPGPSIVVLALEDFFVTYSVDGSITNIVSPGLLNLPPGQYQFQAEYTFDPPAVP